MEEPQRHQIKLSTGCGKLLNISSCYLVRLRELLEVHSTRLGSLRMTWL